MLRKTLVLSRRTLAGCAPRSSSLPHLVLESLFAMIMILTSLHHSNVNRCRALFYTTPACQPRTAMLQWMWSPTGALAHAPAPAGAHTCASLSGGGAPHADDSERFSPLSGNIRPSVVGERYPTSDPWEPMLQRKRQIRMNSDLGLESRHHRRFLPGSTDMPFLLWIPPNMDLGGRRIRPTLPM